MKLLDFLKDGDGALSCTRGALAFLVLIFGIEHLYLTISAGHAPEIDWAQVTVLLGAFGAKTVQSKFENPAAPAAPAIKP